jgi:hypothetical protein
VVVEVERLCAVQKMETERRREEEEEEEEEAKAGEGDSGADCGNCILPATCLQVSDFDCQELN